MSGYTSHYDFGTPDFDPQRAFGATDPGFAARVQTTLEELRNHEAAPVAHGPQNQEAAAAAVAHGSRPPRRRTRWVVLAAAAIFVVLSLGTAFAASNGFGLLERMNSTTDTGPTLPEAQNLVVSGLSQQGGVLPEATFTLDEFIYDGEALWISVTVRPNNPQYVMTCDDYMLAQGAKKLPNGKELPKDQKFSSWAVKNGYTPFLVTAELDESTVQFDESNGSPYGGISGVRFIDDGGVTYTTAITGIQLEPGQKLSLVCTLLPYRVSTGRFDFENREETALDFTISEIPPLPSVASSQPIKFTAAGIVVDYVKLSSSPLTTYCELEYTVVDTERWASYDGVLFARVLDASGQPYLDGHGGGTSLGPAPGNAPGDESRYRYHGVIQAMEELPNEIQLQFFEFNNDKKTIETQSITLS
jgi:hypothetical protein